MERPFPEELQPAICRETEIISRDLQRSHQEKEGNIIRKCFHHVARGLTCKRLKADEKLHQHTAPSKKKRGVGGGL